MAAELNHTIVWCSNQKKSAKFYAEILGLAAPTRFGPFDVVQLANGVSLDFHSDGSAIRMQHYAFLIGEDDFDQVFARVTKRGLDYWADPSKSERGKIYRHNGGRGFYFEDPDGHLLEVLTRPYSASAFTTTSESGESKNRKHK
jgi:catechol 2,3-dioxygenase-like lactoylglutathione lyase family enzyme